MQSLTHHLQTFIASHGLQAVFVLMVLESACIPVPSEVTMIYAGYLVSQGSMEFARGAWWARWRTWWGR